MWLFTTYGFYSIVRDRGQSERFLLRARVREDLERLLAAVGLPADRIAETPNADYRFRYRLKLDELYRVCMALFASITYPNFKDEVARVAGHERAALYGRIWAEMYGLQQETLRREQVGRKDRRGRP